MSFEMPMAEALRTGELELPCEINIDELPKGLFKRLFNKKKAEPAKEAKA